MEQINLSIKRREVFSVVTEENSVQPIQQRWSLLEVYHGYSINDLETTDSVSIVSIAVGTFTLPLMLILTCALQLVRLC